MLSGHRGWLTMITVALWLTLVCSGVAWLWAYTSRSSDEATNVPAEWPAKSQIAPPTDKPKLVLFAHPQCPCARTSIAELEGIVARTVGTLSVAIVVVRPPGAVGPEWESSTLAAAVARMPGAELLADDGRSEVTLFGARTSGQVVVYGSDSRLLFSGGITLGRSHAGDNPGRDAVISIAKRGETDTYTFPVFGCSLLGVS